MKTKNVFFIATLLFSVCLSAQFTTRIVEHQIDKIWIGDPSKKASQLDSILHRIPALLEGTNTLEQDYWKAYTLYKISLFHLADNKEVAKENLESALALLEGMEHSNSEVFALMGTITSTMISVKREKAWSLSQQASKYFRKSLDSDGMNPRAYLGMGKSDFYKPAKYGGGEKVESYLKKTITYYEKEELSLEKGPSWGKDQAYYFLSAFYQRKGREKDAMFYNTRGLKEFPQNSLLLAQKEQLR